MSPQEEFEERCAPALGRTLIAGSFVVEGKPDRRKLYSNVVGVDMQPGPGVDLVRDLEETGDELGVFDHIECLSVLEHSRRPWILAANLEHMLRPGGTIFVAIPWVWRRHSYPSDYFRVLPDGIPMLFPRVRWEQLAYGADRLYKPSEKIPVVKKGSHPYLARAESFGFGVRL